MARRWQYPGQAFNDPDALTRPETPQLDKWWQPLSTPAAHLAKPFILAAVIVSGLTYQGEPIVPPEDITVDKWFSTLSTPPAHLEKRGLHPSLRPAGVIDSDILTQPEAPQLDKWFSALSEPVRVEAPLPVAAYPSKWDDAELLTQAESTSLDKWWQPLAEPQLRDKLLATGAYPSSFFDATPIAAPYNPAGLDWYRATLGVFGRAELRLSGYTPVPVPGIEVVVPSMDSWFRDLETPPRGKARATEFPALSIDPEILTQPEATTPDKWYAPLSEPYLVKEQPNVSFGEFRVEEDLVAAEEITLDKWYRPLSLFPGKVKRSATALEPALSTDADSLTRPEETLLSKWYQPLSEFLHRVKRSAGALEPSTTLDSNALTRPEETLLSKWFSALSEPVLLKKQNVEAQIASGLTYVGEPSDVEPQAERLGWYAPLAEPTLPKFQVVEAPYFSIDSDALTRPEITSLDKWFSPLGEPVWIKRGLRASLQQAFTVDANIAAVPPEEPTQLDKWFQSLSEPLRIKGRASDFPAHTNDTEGLTLPEITSLDKWWRPLDEPLRIKERLGAALQQYLAIDANIASVPPEEVVTLDKWFQPLTEPLRIKPRASEFPPFTVDSDALTRPEATTLDRWFVSLSEPLRVKTPPNVVFGEYRTELAFELVTVDKWFVPLGLPVAPKPLPIAAYPFFSTDVEGLTQPETTSLDKWFVALAEPPRGKTPPNVSFGIFRVDLTLEVVTLDKWYRDLDLPVLKRVLSTANTPYWFAEIGTLGEPEVTTLDKWFTPLAEPVRIGDRLVVPRLPASVGFRLPDIATIPTKSFVSIEADMTHISIEADMTKDSDRC